MHTAQASRLVQGMIIGGGLGPFQTYNRPCEVSLMPVDIILLPTLNN